MTRRTTCDSSGLSSTLSDAVNQGSRCKEGTDLRSQRLSDCLDLADFQVNLTENCEIQDAPPAAGQLAPSRFFFFPMDQDILKTIFNL